MLKCFIVYTPYPIKTNKKSDLVFAQIFALLLGV